ncbi:MAG: carbon-nitrogen hydrolase family protein [Prevotellaceae bacterium]|jgi:predicted amidohydrolase|nr:carbon-nitrogen hydrolase family protein [Prevotellaceae bacterium]
MKKFLNMFFLLCIATFGGAQNASWQSDFTKGETGAIPESWSLTTFSQDNSPRFELQKDGEGAYLLLAGNGDSVAVAYLSTRTRLKPGTYAYKALFSISGDVNPQRNLLFQCLASSHDGIFKFYRLDNGLVEGRGAIEVRGGESRDVELRIYYRFNARGEVKLRSLSLTPAEPVKPRWARFACTQGNLNMGQIAAVAEQAARDSVDLLLYPEHVAQKSGDASLGDTLMEMLSGLAAKHRMYVAASILATDKTDGRKYNRGVLYDRQGILVGVYDKIHPYSPEVNEKGVAPGTKTDIFKTDFGKVGLMICYDSWFTDVTELLALKGAEVILFPVAGYYRSIIPARASDNGVRFVISVLGKSYGIFDTAGRDVQNPDGDSSVGTGGNTFKDVRTFDVDGIGMLAASLDLNCNISPHYNGGKMLEAPGGKRNRADQILYLEDMIKQEKERWWEEE